jgi:hypothetical protein
MFIVDLKRQIEIHSWHPFVLRCILDTVQAAELTPYVKYVVMRM